MRRALPVLFATIGALVLLSTFHTSTGTTVSTAASSSATSTKTTADTSTTTTTQPAPTAPPPGADQQFGGDDEFAPPTTTGPSTTTASLKSGQRTVDGPVVTNRWGEVQVRIVVDGNKLVDVQTVKLPTDRARSAYISEQAGPMLRTEALQAGNANINIIGGATYTSDSYAQSLQGALDQAGIK